MVETMGLRKSILDNITHAAIVGQLYHSHRHKLRPPGCSAESMTTMVLDSEDLEFMSVNLFRNCENTSYDVSRRGPVVQGTHKILRLPASRIIL
jgi:hypothetical protein